MNSGPRAGLRALTLRATLFAATGDLVPYYALYALLFADHGFGPAQISLLLALWSATAFVFEIPSGAWADTVSRRGLLILNGILLATGFLLWTVVPSYLGFALGFVLWGMASALRSGTFEALLYDELTARSESRAYARIIGYTRSASELSAVIAILAATPLYLLGGFALVGWASVGCAVLHTALARSLPAAPRSASAAEVAELEDSEGTEPGLDAAGPAGLTPRPRPATADPATSGSGSIRRYLRMLRTGVSEAVRVRMVRYGVVLGALLYGITAFDEYFGLLAGEAGAATEVVPVLVAVTVIGSLLGSLLAGRTEDMSARTMALAVGAAAVLFGAGALISGLALRWPGAVYVFTGLGFAALAAAYGIVYNAGIIAEARLQDAITGPARATVLSVTGLGEEVVSLAVFGFVALMTAWLSISSTLALLGISLAVIALLTPAWLPPRPRAPGTGGGIKEPKANDGRSTADHDPGS
ncbi:MFS transporter [Nocardia sp. NPDC051750]|uniref:MFS transporter n=1 Tax=Nocardia sp. NPDC051750 TaxID=3364325 RepID=UPI00379BF0DB